MILDLGSEENPRLAREIRALGVYSEIHPHDITTEELEALPGVKGIILNGGPNRVVDGVEIDASQCRLSTRPTRFSAPITRASPPWPADENERMNSAVRPLSSMPARREANWNMENFIADQVELIRAPGRR